MKTLHSTPSTRSQAGMSLIELMIGMLIALLGIIIIFQVFAVSEGIKRTTTGGSDAQQSGSFSTFSLERLLRLGGTGIARIDNIWGCPLKVWQDNTARVPAAYPAPFNKISDAFTSTTSALRLTPALIVNGGGNDDANATDDKSDTLIVMGSQSDSAATPYRSLRRPSMGTTSYLNMVNAVGIKQNDFLLVVDQDPPSIEAQNCWVLQAIGTVSPPVAPATAGVIPNPLAVSFGTTTGPLPDYSATIQFGNLGNNPLFTALGVPDTHDALLSYDLINGTTTSIADNIVNLQAVYGVAVESAAASPLVPKPDCSFPDRPCELAWVAPTGVWSADSLMQDPKIDPNVRIRIGSIRAIRVAVVARSSQLEKASDWSAPDMPLFSDLGGGAAVTVNLGDTTLFGPSGRQYRYRTYDVTIPLRNMLLMNNT